MIQAEFKPEAPKPKTLQVEEKLRRHFRGLFFSAFCFSPQIASPSFFFGSFGSSFC